VAIGPALKPYPTLTAASASDAAFSVASASAMTLCIGQLINGFDRQGSHLSNLAGTREGFAVAHSLGMSVCSHGPHANNRRCGNEDAEPLHPR
jgi:hypothetical protein